MRRIAILGALSLLVGSVILTTGNPAAAIAGLTVEYVTPAASSSTKSITVDCPAGTVATGGGGYLVAGAPKGEIGFDAMTPLANGDYFTRAVEADVNYASSWRATGVALCATAPAGLEYNTAVSGGGSGSTRSVIVPCPTQTKRVLSGGGEITGGNGHVFLTGIVPNADLRSVTIYAEETQTGTVGNWTVTGSIVCADEPAGYEVASTTTASASASYDSMMRVCPGGKELFGTGFMLNGGGGQILLYGMNIVPETTLRMAAAEDADGYASNWSMTEYRICAT